MNATALRFLTLLLLALPIRVFAMDLQQFPYAKVLTPSDSPGKTIGSFVLDEELFDHTSDGFPNLRVVDEEGNETPYTVQTVRHRKQVVTEHRVSSSPMDFELLPDNAFRITVTRESGRAGHPVSFLELISRQQNFEKTVTVSGSDNGRNWTVLADDVPIYDYSRYLDLRNSRVSIDPSSHRMLRIDVAYITENQLSPLVQIARETRDGQLISRIEKTSLRREDFRIEEIRLIELRKTWSDAEAKLRDYTVTGMEVREDHERKSTVVEFATSNAPLRSLRLHIATPCFFRHAVVETQASGPGAPRWIHLTSATLRRVPGGSNSGEQSIGLPRTCRYRRYRITVRNEDSPPLDITSATAQGEVQQALFLCQPGQAYHAIYGAGGLRRPRYDISHVVKAAGRPDTDTYQLGPEKDNPSFEGARRQGLVSGRTLLVVAVIAMVAVLVWFIARAARQV